MLIIRDDDLSGFALRVLTTGRKVFVAQYRVGGGRTGRQRRVKIGAYGTITANQARTKARDILAQAQLGQDADSALKAPTIPGNWRPGIPTN